MPARRRKEAESSKRKATRRRASCDLELAAVSHIGQRPPPASSCPPLAGTGAAVDHGHGGEAGSEGSGPLPSAAGAKGVREGETAPFGFPLAGRRAKPAGDDRDGSRRLRVIACRRAPFSAPAERAMGLVCGRRLRASLPRSTAACRLPTVLAAHGACGRGGDRGEALLSPGAGVGCSRREDGEGEG